MLVLEARGDDEAKDHAARALLERAGMVFYAKQATNQWCVHDLRAAIDKSLRSRRLRGLHGALLQ